MNSNKIKMPAMMLAAGVLMLASCKGNTQQQGKQAPELAVLTVSQSDAALETAYPATLEGENDVEIRPQVSGFLTKVLVDDGDHVSKGQTLFLIDQVQLQAAVDQAQAAVAVAQANVNTCQTNATNNKILLDKNIISASAYQTSEDALNSAKAQLSQAQAALTSARKNLSYTVVKAPAAGVVGTIDFKEGALVSPSTLLTMLSNNGEMDAVFSMTEKDLLSLTANGSRTLKEALAAMPEVSLQLADGNIYPYKGKVISVSGVLNAATGSATAKAHFPNPDGILHTGNTGKVLMPAVRNEVIMIPQKATYEVQDLKYVFVVNDSSQLVARNIVVAPENDGQNYIVLTGLNPGETILTEGVGISARAGMTIKPKAQAAAAAPAPEAAPADSTKTAE